MFLQGFRAYSTQRQGVKMEMEGMEGIEPGVVGLFGTRFLGPAGGRECFDIAER